MQLIGNVTAEYRKMSEDEKARLVLSGTKALIAGAVKYNAKKSIPSIYSLLLENSPWHSTVDYFANILKKYGGEKSVNEVIGKAVADFAEGVKDKSAP